jgi:hypothetical protein
LHRVSGFASFILFPLFLIGGMMAIQAEAITLAKDPAAADNLVIAQFGFFDPLANIGFALLYFGGLKHRRNVQLHSRYMLATLLFLVAPLIWRLLQSGVPMFDSSTPETAYRFSYAMAAGNAGALLLTYGLYRQAPKYGRPFLIAMGFIAAQQVLFETAGRLDAWALIFAQVAHVDPLVLLGATGIGALAIAWAGWQAGKHRAPGAQAAQD